MTPRERAEALVGGHHTDSEEQYCCPKALKDPCVWSNEKGGYIYECNCSWESRVAAIERALLDTIEECAKVAEKCFNKLDPADQGFVSSVTETIAAEIRKMGK